MNNYKMTVQYDGTRYSGWQKQGNTENTIQGRLEQTLSALLGEDIQVIGAGRTDAGVHAKGQAANFKTEQRLAPEEFLPALNQILPGDLGVSRLVPASPRFHARLNAKQKTYRYTIHNSVIPDVFGRRYAYQLPDPLDTTDMEQAAHLLLGTHDFKGFSTGHTRKSTVRHLASLELSKTGSDVCLTYTGNGFLYNMVRILTGTLVEIGLGTRKAESILEVLDTGDRQKAGFTAPPQGLCLMEVIY